MGHAAGRDTHDDQPTTDLGRVVNDVLKAAPTFWAGIKSMPEAHGLGGHGQDDCCDICDCADCRADTCRKPEHRKGCADPACKACEQRRKRAARDACRHAFHSCDVDCLDDGLRRTVCDIGEDLRQKRNPAGIVANCNEALDRLVSAYGALNGSKAPDPAAGPARATEQVFAALVIGVLVVIGVVAAAYLLFAVGTDVVYPPVSDADYRQFAYPPAVDAPNLANWLAWAILILALAGAALWAAGRVSLPAPRSRISEPEHGGLRGLYERGLISRDMYQRGRRLACSDPLLRPVMSEAYAREYAAYIMALADGLCFRRLLDDAALYRAAGEPVVKDRYAAF